MDTTLLICVGFANLITKLIKSIYGLLAEVLRSRSSGKTLMVKKAPI